MRDQFVDRLGRTGDRAVDAFAGEQQRALDAAAAAEGGQRLAQRLRRVDAGRSDRARRRGSAAWRWTGSCGMRLAPSARRCKACTPSWTRSDRSAKRCDDNPNRQAFHVRQDRQTDRIAERPAGHPGAEDRRRQQCRAAGPRAGARRPAGDRDHHAHAGRAGSDPPRRGRGSRSGGRRRHDPQCRAVRPGRQGRLQIHRQPGRHRARSSPRRATARCRCCPAPSRRAR